MLEEIALRLDQIAGLEHHRLGFVEDREIQQAGSGRGLAVLDLSLIHISEPTRRS
mgnify:CR=1 FL=1